MRVFPRHANQQSMHRRGGACGRVRGRRTGTTGSRRGGAVWAGGGGGDEQGVEGLRQTGGACSTSSALSTRGIKRGVRVKSVLAPCVQPRRPSF